MWLWEEDAEPDSDRKPNRDADLSSDVRRLRSWFSEARKRNPEWIFGYGRGWTPFSTDAYPLILLNSDATAYWSLPSSWQRRLRPIDQLPVRLRELLGSPETKLTLFTLAVPEPEASFKVTDVFDSLRPIRNGVLCLKTGRIGSTGATVKLSDGSLGVVTAGHVLPFGEGSAVSSVNGLSFWNRTKPFGTVEHHSVPIGTTAGWDAAIIRPSTQLELPKRAKTRWPSVRNGQELTYARGARSGFVDTAVLIAGLEEIEASPLSWSCCWLIGPPTALTAGDSGAAVFVRETNELLGTYVGVSKVGSGTPHAAYVQDAESLQQNLLKKWNVSF